MIRLYVQRNIDIDKSQKVKQLLNLCTKDIHCLFDGKFYMQNDSVSMGLPLGAVFGKKIVRLVPLQLVTFT